MDRSRAGMIDLHTHILPGVDDGASTLEEALYLTELLEKQHVKGAVCTPHFNPVSISLQEFVGKRNAAQSRMKDSRITLYMGSETFLHKFLFYYSDLADLCIENTRYLLLELPYEAKWKFEVFQQLETLLRYYDLLPVIAHIERYPAVRRKEEEIRHLREIGCLIQTNTGSLFDRQIHKQIFHWMEKGYIDVLGSDCHNTTSRPPVISDALALLDEKFGEEYTESLIQNGDTVIKGIKLRQVKKSYEIS